MNLPATTLIDLHLVVEDAVGRLGGEDAAASLVETLNQRLFEPETQQQPEGWNNPHGAVPSTADAAASSQTAPAGFGEDSDDGTAGNGAAADTAPKRKGRRKRARKR